MKDKIPFYNIINMFFVGAVFTFLIFILFINQIKQDVLTSPVLDFLSKWSVVVSALLIIIMYEIGFILNRASSILLTPLFAKTKIWPRDKYDIDISEISEKNKKFQSLITDLVFTRTHILLYLIVAVVSLFSTYKWAAIICAVIILILIIAGRRNNAYINRIRQSYAENKSKLNDNSDKESK